MEDELVVFSSCSAVVVVLLLPHQDEVRVLRAPKGRSCLGFRLLLLLAAAVLAHKHLVLPDLFGGLNKLVT
jgi:hypothetical protein